MMRMRKFLAEYVCTFLSVFLLLVCLPLQAVAAEGKVVRVGWYEGGYNITGPGGERSGYGYEFQQTVAAYTGWRYEYVEGSSMELLEKLQRGEIDMLNCISYTPERAQHMLFSSLPMGREKYYLYANIEKTGLSPSKMHLLEGKGVSMMASSMLETAFSNWEKQQGLHTQHLPADSMEERKGSLSKERQKPWWRRSLRRSDRRDCQRLCRWAARIFILRLAKAVLISRPSWMRLCAESSRTSPFMPSIYINTI